MQLLCRRCGLVIEPQEEMVTVEVGRPDLWSEPDKVAKRLSYAPARWHHRCAPKPVKKYTSAVSP
jgi:hypothetical protein